MPRPTLLATSRMLQLAVTAAIAYAVSAEAAAPPSSRRAAAPTSSAAREQARTSRLQRRDRHRAEIQATLGPLASDPDLVAEYGMHAWRMARIRRMQQLAAELEKRSLQSLLLGLELDETRRHAEHVLRKRHAGGAAPKPASPKLPPAVSRPAREH